MEEAQLSVVPMVAFLVKEQTISIIGAGSLGTEVIDALYHKGHRRIIATRRDEDKLRDLRHKYSGIGTTTDNKSAAENSDVIILAIKSKLEEESNMIYEVAEEISEYTQGKLVISLAAAKPLNELEHYLSKSRVARVMTGINVKDEVAAYTLGENCVEEDEEVIKYLFGTNAREVEEEHLAGRTWIACDVGIMAKEYEAKVKALTDSGLTKEDVASFYAGTLRALAEGIESGKTGDEIYLSVAGPKSFTGDLYDSMAKEGHFDLLIRLVTETVKKLK
jgi:pyrroline-5-carboxylate reductase